MPDAAPSFWAEIMWGIIGLGLLVWSLTGGADLGAGLWSLLASGPRKAEQRDAVHEAIAPIWEANHVWLIFVIVVMFSAFSRAFAILGIALHIPIAFALLGLVLRGSAYVFRAYGIQSKAAETRWEQVFAGASVVTPVFLGLVVAGVSSGAIRVVDDQVTTGFLAGWTSAYALSVGVFALALFGLLSAVYLSYETREPLASDFRKRALIMEVVSGALAAITFAFAVQDAPQLFEHLARSPWTWPVQIATAVSAGATVYLLIRRRYAWARWTVVLQVGLVVVGWGLAMRGHLILPDVTLTRATSNPQVMPALVLVFAGGSVLLVPALWYLYRVFKGAPQR